jgi:hypothetical protein
MWDPIAEKPHFGQRLSTVRSMGPGATLALNPFKIYVGTLA